MGRSLFGPLLFSAHPFRPTFDYINYMHVLHEYWSVYYFNLLYASFSLLRAFSLDSCL